MSVKSLIDRKPISGLYQVPSDVWQRPNDWLTLDTLGPNDQKIIGLMAIYNDESNYIAFTCSGTNGAYTVDWGDGTSDNYATGVKAQHRYNWSDISSDTLTSEGFRQAIITVTPQAGQTLGSVTFQAVHSDCANGTGTTLLELRVAITGSLTLSNFSTNVCYLSHLRILTIANHATNMNSTLLRGNAQNVTQFFITKALNINGSGPFQTSDSLEYVYTHPNFTVSDCSNLFLNCTRLKYAPLFNTSSCANFTSMFQGCVSLRKVPTYNTNSATNFTSMFQGCVTLEESPIVNAPSVTNFTSMFQGCATLKSVRNFNNTATTVNCTTMFNGCSNLISVERFRIGTIATSTNMFSGCVNLRNLGALRFISVTTGAFSNCHNFIPTSSLYGQVSTGGISGLVGVINGLKTFPAMTLIGGTSSGLSITGISLLDIEAINLNGVSQGNGSSFSTPMLRRCQVTGLGGPTSFANRMLGRTAIHEIISNLRVPSTTQTLTITGNPGATVNPIYTRSSTTTANSATVSVSDTSNLTVGMQVTGTGIDSARSVTLTDAGDTVTLAGHGLPNGKLVTFTSITTTTGIGIYNQHYVVNATTDTFQLSLTEGGSAIAFTNNGSGTLIYQTLITAITPNTDVTIDVPASAGGTNTLSFRNLNTQIAVMKRWTVTG